MDQFNRIQLGRLPLVSSEAWCLFRWPILGIVKHEKGGSLCRGQRRLWLPRWAASSFHWPTSLCLWRWALFTHLKAVPVSAFLRPPFTPLLRPDFLSLSWFRVRLKNTNGGWLWSDDVIYTWVPFGSLFLYKIFLSLIISAPECVNFDLNLHGTMGLNFRTWVVSTIVLSLSDVVWPVNVNAEVQLFLLKGHIWMNEWLYMA